MSTLNLNIIHVVKLLALPTDEENMYARGGNRAIPHEYTWALEAVEHDAGDVVAHLPDGTFYMMHTNCEKEWWVQIPGPGIQCSCSWCTA